MKTSRIILGFFVLSTTACLEARTSRDTDRLQGSAVLASMQDGDAGTQTRYPAEIRIAAVFKPGSADAAIRVPGLEIGCMPWGFPSFGPEFMAPESVEFPGVPTDDQCRDVAEDLLSEGWSLGLPIDGVAKCCLIGGVWVPCHPGWDTRAFPVLRDRGPDARPYSRTMTVSTRGGAEENVQVEYLVVVSPAEVKPIDAHTPVR